MKKLLAQCILLLFTFSSFSQAPTNGLILHLKFDGNTLDNSGENNNADAANIVYVNDRFNIPNKAVKKGIALPEFIDGLSVTNTSSIALIDEFTVSFWLKNSNTFGVSQKIFYKGTPNFGAKYYYLYNPFGGPSTYPLTFGDQSFGYYLNSSLINNWAYYTYTHKAGLLKFYRNGVEINISSPTGNNQITIDFNQVNFGDLFLLGGNDGYAIDEFRLYNRTLSNEEIIDIYNEESINPKIYYTEHQPTIHQGNTLKVRFKAKSSN